MNEQVTDEFAREDYWLDFEVPPELMPDPQFNELKARIQVHRVRPVYANGKRPSEPPPAVVLIHGRSVPGPVVFDLQDPPRVTAPGGGPLNLSVQVGLAKAGIDTFARACSATANRRGSTRASTIPATRAFRPTAP